jgi:5-formyltetrahydrofolate cyclo-ligase
MEFHLCEDVSQLRAGAWKILEPDARNCPVVAPNEIELLLIPGLAFTVDGKRLGRGGGHYDRFLERAQPRAVKIGVCFHAQLVAEMPVEIHDREVDRVITERSPR